MPRRLPIFFPLALAATVGLFALTSVAQPPKPATPGDNPAESIKKGEEENQRMYKRFSEELLRLAQKWEKSENPDDRERAKNLRSAYDLAKTKGIDKMYKDLVAGVTGTKNPTGAGFESLLRDDQKLILALEEILNVLNTEDELAKLRREILELTELKKQIERIKREQDNIRARTENAKGDPNKLAKDQQDLANQTKDLANRNSKDGKDSKSGEPKKGGDNAGQKDDKSEPKTQPKPGETAGEDKPETKESKASDKTSQGEPKGGDPKPSPKNGDAGQDKESPPMGGDPKAGGEPKPMDPKAATPQDPKPSDSKAQGENKGEPKPSDGKPGGEGKPMGGEAKPNDSQASAKPPSPPSGGSPNGGSPPPPSESKKNPIEQNLDEAVPPQSGAADDLKKNDRNNASKKEDEAIKKLEKALEELEKLLKQKRDKEQLKLLANLEQRIGTMLQKQIDVYEATKSIDRAIKKNNNTRSPADNQKAGIEADKERAIVAIANDALKLMEGEGSAVVFAGVMVQVKQDMENIAKRLDNTYVGADTQLIEEEVIAQLQLMLEAVKKAKKEAEEKQNKPNDSPPNPNNPNKNLIDKLAELKLIRALQMGVNTRTQAYSKQYPGEQVNDPIIQGELKQLGDRQKVLQDMLHKMATGANQ